MTYIKRVSLALVICAVNALLFHLFFDLYMSNILLKAEWAGLLLFFIPPVLFGVFYFLILPKRATLGEMKTISIIVPFLYPVLSILSLFTVPFIFPNETRDATSAEGFIIIFVVAAYFISAAVICFLGYMVKKEKDLSTSAEPAEQIKQD